MAHRDIAELLERRNTDLLEEHPAINARDARVKFSKIVQAARFGKNRVIITEHGEPAAGLVSIEDIRLLDYLSQLASRDGETSSSEMSLNDLKELLQSDRRGSSVPDQGDSH
jgi:prevent-host-death family protein